jgi:hypothetical protein
MEHKFITYIRTAHFINLRHDNRDVFAPVFVSSVELRERFFLTSSSINKFIDDGVLEVTEKITSNGNLAKYYRAMLPGPIDMSLLPPKESQPLSRVTLKMRQQLGLVSLIPKSPSTIYFDAFLKYFQFRPDLFFVVDNFSGRVHTPVTNFKSEYRKNILLNGKPTTSLDVATMQPLLLGKLIYHHIGNNDYTDWIEKGDDIYEVLRTKSGLATRDEAKKLFFQILFSKPSDELSKLFGNADWINWVNQYKSAPIKENPTTPDKIHNNLAWALQSKEVEVMTKVWDSLIKHSIPFLSVHDEIIVKEIDLIQAEILFTDVLKSEFKYFKLNRKSDQCTLKNDVSVQSEPNADEIKQILIAAEPQLDYVIEDQVLNESSKLDAYKAKNPHLKLLINKLIPESDTIPFLNVDRSNDVEYAINILRDIIEPDKMYTLEEVNVLISKSILTLNTNYNLIIQGLIDAKIITINPFYDDGYYKYRSTPF